MGFKDEIKGTQTDVHFGNLCCKEGKIDLHRFPDLPPGLLQLYQSSTMQAKYFRDNIRYFNSGMSFACMLVTDKTMRRYGPASFKICGIVHRMIGPVLQQQGSNDPHYMQTYFHDPDFQAKHRASRGNSGVSPRYMALREKIFRTLHTILSEECNNTYLQSFLSVHNFVQENNLNPEELSIVMHATDKPPTGHHPGRYNLPTAPELSLIKDANPPLGAHRSIQCNVRGQQQEGSRDRLTTIQDYHRSYIPLIYVLLFPHGTDGWTFTTTDCLNREVRLLEWVRFHIMSRPTHYNFLHHARKLYQQYLVDKFEQNESEGYSC